MEQCMQVYGTPEVFCLAGEDERDIPRLASRFAIKTRQDTIQTEKPETFSTYAENHSTSDTIPLPRVGFGALRARMA